jgi:thymidine kinase
MIEVICGPMFSGKTEELIRRLKRVAISGQTYIVIKPKIASRYDAEDTGISTHDETNSLNAVAVEDCIADIYYATEEYNVVAIDEAQFFSEKLYQVVMMLADSGKRIIISGLDTDFRRKPFPTIANLMSVADKVDKLHSICMGCKEDAIYSLRTSNETDLMVIGNQDTYLPLCRKCYNNKKDGTK